MEGRDSLRTAVHGPQRPYPGLEMALAGVCAAALGAAAVGTAVEDPPAGPAGKILGIVGSVFLVLGVLLAIVFIIAGVLSSSSGSY